MIDSNGRRITRHVSQDGMTVMLDFGCMTLDKRDEVRSVVAAEEAAVGGRQVNYTVTWIADSVAASRISGAEPEPGVV